MKIELYEYGPELQLKHAGDILKEALGSKMSKCDKDIRIAEAMGIIDTIWMLIKDSSSYEEGVTNV